MDTLIALFEKSPRASSGLNLIACAIGVAWTLGVRTDSKLARRGWVWFWVTTGIYYLIETIHPDLRISRVGLYSATVCLLSSFDPARQRAERPRAWWAIVAIFIVAAAVGADGLASIKNYEPSGHQLLTTIAIGAWAWRAREVDMSGSMIIMAYALVQLPIHQLLVSGGVDPGVSYDDFVRKTFAIYAGLKLALIPAVASMLKGSPSR